MIFSKINDELILDSTIKLPYYILEMIKGDTILDRLVFQKKKDVVNFLEVMHSHSFGKYYELKMEKVEVKCKSCKSLKVTEKTIPYFKIYPLLDMHKTNNKALNKK